MNKSSDSLVGNYNQIYWQCRRGMRELDILLQNFFCNQFGSLNTSEKNAFVDLLTLQDTELLEYLMGRKSTNREELDKLVKKIRDAV